MSLVVVVGWLATAVGTVLGLPQLVRLARTRNVDGLSLIGWQAILAINLGWASHGLKIGQWPQIFTSTVGLVSTLPILFLMAREAKKAYVPTLLPGLGLAATMIAVDYLLGSAAYGWYAIVPATVALGGQSIALVRSPHVLGVSTPSMILGTLNQALWTTWSVLINDPGSMIAAWCASVMVAFNIVWFALRRFGLRAFFPYQDAVEPAPVLVGVCPEAAEA
jgi:uncharacterized protein with PQ loop repeat